MKSCKQQIFISINTGKKEKAWAAHRIELLMPEWLWQVVDVAGWDSPIRFQDRLLPRCQRGSGEAAEKTQVQITKVTTTEFFVYKLS